MNEQNLRTQSELVTEGVTFKRSSTSEDTPFLKHGDGMELEALDLLPPLQTTAVTESTRTQPPAVPRKTGHTLNLHRKHRSLLHKRQTLGSSGKSRRHDESRFETRCAHGKSFLRCIFVFGPAVCPGVTETSQQVSQVRTSYRWVLNIPGKNLRMNFQEVN